MPVWYGALDHVLYTEIGATDKIFEANISDESLYETDDLGVREENCGTFMHEIN